MEMEFWRWNSSTVKSPTHKYSAKGNYTVTLTVTNAAGSNTVTKSSYIKVTTASKAGCRLLGLDALRKSTSECRIY